MTFTDPEIAQVGLPESQTREQSGDKVRALKWSFEENDRAQTERESEGLVKAVVGARGKILGASIAGAHAGELSRRGALANSIKHRTRPELARVACLTIQKQANRRIFVCNKFGAEASKFWTKKKQPTGRENGHENIQSRSTQWNNR